MLVNHKADIIHSHLLKTDNICLEIAQEQKIPVVTTVHGDYLQFYNKTQLHKPIPLLNYFEKAKYNLQRLSHIICISDRQISFFNHNFAELTRNKLSKIYNGYDGVASSNSVSLRKM